MDLDRRRPSVLRNDTSDTRACSPPAPAARRATWPASGPARWPLITFPIYLLDGVDVVVVRLLGGQQAWPDGLAALRRQPLPLIVLGGEMNSRTPQLMALSSVPCRHRRAGAPVPGSRRPGKPAQKLANFLADTVLMGGGNGFYAPRPSRCPPGACVPWRGPAGRSRLDPTHKGEPVVAMLYYCRAHELVEANTATLAGRPVHGDRVLRCPPPGLIWCARYLPGPCKLRPAGRAGHGGRPDP